MRKKVAWVALFCGIGVLGVGGAPRFIEELCVGGGYGESRDGGADLAADGTVVTDSYVQADGGIRTPEAELGEGGSLVFGGPDGYAVRHNTVGDRLELALPDGSSGYGLEADGTSVVEGDMDVEGDADFAGCAAFGNRAAPASGRAVNIDLEQTGASYAWGLRSIVRPKASADGYGRAHGGEFRVVPDTSSAVNYLDFMFGTVAYVAPPAADKSTSNVVVVAASVDRTSADNCGTIENCRLFDASMTGSAYGSVGDLYGLYVGGMTAGSTSNYAIYTNSGKVRLGDNVECTAAGAFQGGLESGKDGVYRGLVTAWDGSGGNYPGCLRLGSGDGTLWYVFSDNEGQLRVSSSAPVAADAGQPVGRREIVLPAKEAMPAGSGGCGFWSGTALGPDGAPVGNMLYDGAADEHAFWSVVLPCDYEGGGFKAVVYWAGTDGTVGQTVAWRLRATCVGDGDTFASATWGGVASAVDELLAVEALQIAETATDLAVQGDPGAGDVILLNLYRDADDATDDTLTGDARLIALGLAY